MGTLADKACWVPVNQWWKWLTSAPSPNEPRLLPHHLICSHFQSGGLIFTWGRKAVYNCFKGNTLSQSFKHFSILITIFIFQSHVFNSCLFLSLVPECRQFRSMIWRQCLPAVIYLSHHQSVSSFLSQQHFAEYLLNSVLWFRETDYAVATLSLLTPAHNLQSLQTSYDPSSLHGRTHFAIRALHPVPWHFSFALLFALSHLIMETHPLLSQWLSQMV